MTHHGLLNVHKSRLKYFGRCQVGISASTSEGKKTRSQKFGKTWEIFRKIWEKVGKVGKVGKIWEKLGKIGKSWENGKKSEKFQEKSGISRIIENLYETSPIILYYA